MSSNFIYEKLSILNFKKLFTMSCKFDFFWIGQIFFRLFSDIVTDFFTLHVFRLFIAPTIQINTDTSWFNIGLKLFTNLGIKFYYFNWNHFWASNDIPKEFQFSYFSLYEFIPGSYTVYFLRPQKKSHFSLKINNSLPEQANLTK